MSGMNERTAIIVGEDGLERLRNARAVLCGCGAVGGYALEGLVRAGVGHIRVIDKDVFSESNINRQILATTDTVGRVKVEVACERARSINPDIDIEGLDILVSDETIPSILEGDFDVLVDAIDTVGMKTKLLEKACEIGIPTFSSMGAALHTDAAAVRIANIRDTSVCPIAAKVRRALRDLDSSKITCVYSLETPVTVPTERDECGKSILGSLPTIPAIFGMSLANEAIAYILKR
ncbi:Dinucleotide-utilizing enzymes involved in molybdopterin and thiamine biosynthesis family 1 [Thermoplasmatales archaeon BRNA1]|nr:Dinucleotide-utilizing enzymes involved in molybdopterin and thiamine biosynthesis family 1 [Thermoplasmatales archaeon BRNA1]